MRIQTTVRTITCIVYIDSYRHTKLLNLLFPPSRDARLPRTTRFPPTTLTPPSLSCPCVIVLLGKYRIYITKDGKGGFPNEIAASRVGAGSGTSAFK